MFFNNNSTMDTKDNMDTLKQRQNNSNQFKSNLKIMIMILQR